MYFCCGVLLQPTVIDLLTWFLLSFSFDQLILFQHGHAMQPSVWQNGLNVRMLSPYWACMCGVIREERNLLIPIILVRSLPGPCILFLFSLSHTLPTLPLSLSSRVHLQLRSLLDG